MTDTVIEIEPGDTTDVPLQCRIRGSGAASKYTAGDVLSAELWPPRATVAMASGLPVAWLQVNPTTGQSQTGYDQGQVVVSLLTSIGALQPTVTYTLKVFRVMASDPTRRERIAEARIRVVRAS